MIIITFIVIIPITITIIFVVTVGIIVMACSIENAWRDGDSAGNEDNDRGCDRDHSENTEGDSEAHGNWGGSEHGNERFNLVVEMAKEQL